MALSKSQRIMILLGIDGAFFLLELIVGYSTHSLALVADAFHMLNDVLSLCVGLWAVKVANQKTNSKMYTYGWQRAETLGALVNGVFLVALCLSIFLEAIQRFFEPQEVSNPGLVLIVGCFGLLSNILGLLLFHEHSHGHGHAHGEEAYVEHGDDETAVEEEESHSPITSTQYGTENINGDAKAGDSKNGTANVSATDHQEPAQPKPSISWPQSASSRDADHPASPYSPSRRHRRRTSSSRTRYTSVDEIHIHPASFRNEIIAASRMESIESEPVTESENENSSDETQHASQETSSLLPKRRISNSKDINDLHHATHKHRKPRSDSEDHHGHGHSHGDLNMRGVFLHVMGDALGNVGVIASALFIWQTTFSWRFYTDPAISLIITFIILCSAIPLCRAASRILLQAVPAGLSIDDIKEDIEDLPGVVSCHHLHVWQLNDTKLVASLHMQVAFDYRGTDAKQYMRLAKAVRTCLHEYGIHSSTIQPEFCLDAGHQHVANGATGSSDGATLEPGPVPQVDGSSALASKAGSKITSRAASMMSSPDACLLDCDDGCGRGRGCCPADSKDGGQGQGH